MNEGLQKSRTIEVAGVIPAAGASRRMGRDKRRLPLRGSTVLAQTVNSLRQGGLTPLLVILEPDSPCIGLAGLEDAQILTNPAPERGMLSSIRVGLAAVPASAAAVAVLPGDHPFVPAEAVARIIEHVRQHRPRLLVPRFGDKRGHPLILDRSLLDEAMACDDTVGLRQLVRRHEEELVVLDLPFLGAEHDLDTPDDLHRLEE
jgi:molybdenum cofactor cytidylyltransferase